MKTKEGYEAEEQEDAMLDTKKAKVVIDDIKNIAQRLARLTRRFSNTQQQAEAVASTLRLMAGIKESKIDPDTPVQFSFRATFRLCEHNAIDATIDGLLLPVSTIAEEILAPIAAAGLNGLTVMREELEEVEEVVNDANTTYEAFTCKPNPEDLN
jgi:hypothetical protein